jgi:hypothetical protein
MTTPRKIVQIAAIPETAECDFAVLALADDGTIWSHCPKFNGTSWEQMQLNSLPEREE